MEFIYTGDVQVVDSSIAIDLLRMFAQFYIILLPPSDPLLTQWHRWSTACPVCRLSLRPWWPMPWTRRTWRTSLRSVRIYEQSHRVGGTCAVHHDSHNRQRRSRIWTCSALPAGSFSPTVRWTRPPSPPPLRALTLPRIRHRSRRRPQRLARRALYRPSTCRARTLRFGRPVLCSKNATQ